MYGFFVDIKKFWVYNINVDFSTNWGVFLLERFEKFSFAISKISRCWNKIATEEMEKYELKGPCALYLLTIYRSQDGITAAKLAEVCSRDKADVSRSVSLMENNGLIIKESNNKNLYRAKIMLTEKGKAAAENISRRACLAVETAGGNVSEENRTIFYNTLEHIADNLQMISEDGLPE